jgi:hypothetical protein
VSYIPPQMVECQAVAADWRADAPLGVGTPSFVRGSARRRYFFAGATGTMMCAYGVPFHITHGAPLCRVVGIPCNEL